MTYFFDANISVKIVRALRELGVDAIRQTEKFPTKDDRDDEIWLRQLKDTEYVIVTGDKRILSRKKELDALRYSSCTTLFLAPFFLKLEIWGQVAWIFKQWPQIVYLTEHVRSGTLLELQQRGANRPIA